MVLRQYKLSSFGETKRLLSIGDIYDRLLFQEKLYVFNNDGKRVGRFSIKVEPKEIRSCENLVVHISNRGIFEGRLSESVVTGAVTMNLKTMEEIRHELSEMDNGKHVRRFYLLRERTKYYYSVTESVGEIERKHQSTIPFAKTSGLIGEAGNIMLMRAIVVRGYEGIICVKTILSNGERCQNYYISKSAERMVNGTKMDVMIVYRSVTDHCNYNVTSTCTFTKAGQLVNLFWSNSEYFLHIDPDLEIYSRMATNKPVALHRHWNRDKQVFSYYLDKKNEILATVRSYRMRNEELKRVMADWVQLVLLSKPSDIICSAIQFFTSFGNKTLRQCGSIEEDEKNF